MLLQAYTFVRVTGGDLRSRVHDRFAELTHSETGATAAVVRPDRYVYGVARTPAELARLIGDLGRALAG